MLVFGGLAGAPVAAAGGDCVVEANGLPEDYRFLLIPFAFVPMIHAVLLGRGWGRFRRSTSRCSAAWWWGGMRW